MGAMRALLSVLGLGGRKIPPSRRVRKWSNQELKRFASLYTGRVINVSAWRDEDKEGGYYRDYFINASTYVTSNYQGWRGDERVSSMFIIDLEQSIPEELVRSFDVVFNHTTLEHVYHVFDAFRNLCLLSNDTVILVTPFLQHLHGPEYVDYWRLTPYCVRRMFADNGYEVLYESGSVTEGGAYLFHVASREPAKWRGKVPEARLDDRPLRKVRLQVPQQDRSG